MAISAERYDMNIKATEFQIRVVETVVVEKVYTVQADNIEGAMMKAKMGEKVKEEVVKQHFVISRELKG